MNIDDIVNKVFCCDNILLLKNLPNECIDLIYCDILYGTNKKHKEYKDLECNRKIIEDFYISRVEQMHRILKSTGSIYLQMDWRIDHWIRCILEDIFGQSNFRNHLIWEYGAGDVNAKNRFRRCHDDILFYVKSDKAKYNIRKDEKGKKLKDYFYIPSFAQKIFQKRYFREQNDYKTYYYSQKPKALIEHIIKASSNEKDLVADFFCGSGTTGVMAKKLRRRYLLCDNSKVAIQITKRRIKNEHR